MDNQNRIRILSVDDHPLFREGIATVINNQQDLLLVASATNGNEAIKQFSQYQPDITLMDLRLPDLSGIDTLIAIRTEFPEARIIMLTSFEGDMDVRRALAAGAKGYLLKNMRPKELVAAIREVHAGKKYIPPNIASNLAEYFGDDALTEREISVLKKIADGNSNREIAEILFISEETVKVHIRHIMEKLGATDRTQSMTIAARRGIIEI